MLAFPYVRQYHLGHIIQASFKIMRNPLLLFFIVLNSLVFSPFTMAQAPQNTEGEVRYISDDLFTFLRSGPGDQFRFLGPIIAGTQVKVLQENLDAGWIEIIDEQQRTGWVDAQFISKRESFRVKVPELQQQLTEANLTLKQQATDNDLLNQRIIDLNSLTANLESKLAEIEEENRTIKTELEQHDQTAQIEWFTRGGIVAIISLLLGIILTYLPKKRRRNDNWM